MLIRGGIYGILKIKKKADKEEEKDAEKQHGRKIYKGKTCAF